MEQLVDRKYDYSLCLYIPDATNVCYVSSNANRKFICFQNRPLGAQAFNCPHTWNYLPGPLGLTVPHYVYCHSGMGRHSWRVCRDTDKSISVKYHILFQYAHHFWSPLCYADRSDDLAMGFDFIILVFTAVALLGRHSARTDLWKLLFHDGLVYFLISFSTNSIPAVCSSLINTGGISTLPFLSRSWMC